MASMRTSLHTVLSILSSTLEICFEGPRHATGGKCFWVTRIPCDILQSSQKRDVSFPPNKKVVNLYFSKSCVPSGGETGPREPVVYQLWRSAGVIGTIFRLGLLSFFFFSVCFPCQTINQPYLCI